MKRRRWYLVGAALAVVATLSVTGFAVAGSSSPKLTKVTIQLKWVTQSQFAGYYAAKAKGYYKAAGLDVNLKIGGPTIINEQTVLSKQAEFGVNWFPSLLANRDQGNDLVNIAQVYPRSGTTEVTWKKDGITNFKQMRGKKFGVWIYGNEFEQRAALVKNGIDPDKDVTLVQQQFDMVAFLNHEIDAASAMTYNELAQVLETKNPDTGKLYTMKDLNVFKYSDLGTGMLQDGIFVRGDWIKSKANQATAVRFLEATFKGWIYCRDHYRECTNIVVSQGTALPKGHQLWQMNEVNALIWPNKLGIGVMNPVDYAKTAKISLDFKVIKKPASKASYRTDLAKKAVANLRKQGLDVYGKGFKKAVVVLKAGGK
ncbi:MAG TPA: ABC transporter substrate-binding protein [Gaiellaceae bacterium]|nr:ABC transporter substrate-binding protein [Gaiellaceae bacterium]